MIKQKLTGTWQIENLTTGESCSSEITGTVISAFCDNGIFEDPNFRMNEYKVREAMRDKYKFSRQFYLDEKCLENKNIDLVCYGIDTLGTIFLNDHEVKKVNNMHRTWRIPCKKYLKKGDNYIEICFESPIGFIENYQPTEGKEISFISSGVMGGNQYLRKAHSMFGWDWGPQLPDIGIWRDIELQIYDEIRLEEASFTQEHKDGIVYLNVNVPVLGGDACSCKIEIHVEFENECQKVILQGDKMVAHTFVIQSPRLWWPNGYGDQPLYKVKIFCKINELEIIEEKEYSIGLRTLSISRNKDKWGSEFAFCINGIKIFTKGANYIPEDTVYSRITNERLDYLTDCAVRANYNCLRVWGGGYYPSDYFYDLCDKKGLIVWQDFMFACNIYELTEEFENNIVEEIYDNVKRLRHHACLGMWCGNNEIESAWENWGGFKEHSKKLRADYIKQFEYILPKALRKVDNETFYWPSSPSSGGAFDKPDSPNEGDVHYWDVWHGQKPFSEFRKHFFRFCSEFGFQSLPCMKTIKTFTQEEDYNIFSKVMESHQKNDSANGKILFYLSELFLYPKDFESMIYISQVLQGLAIKAGVEHWRNNRGRCMGTLYWQMNDNWPVTSWSSVDYYGRWKALHYMARKFYASLNGTLERNGYHINVYLQNETLHSRKAKITLNIKDFDFQIIHSTVIEKSVDSLSAELVFDIDYEKIVKGKEEEVFLESITEFEDAKQIIQTETFAQYKHLKLKRPEYNVEVSEVEKEYLIRVRTNTFAPFLQLELVNMDGIFSDNYFNVVSQEGVGISICKKDIWNGEPENMNKMHQEIRIRSLYDTYMNY